MGGVGGYLIGRSLGEDGDPARGVGEEEGERRPGSVRGWFEMTRCIMYGAIRSGRFSSAAVTSPRVYYSRSRASGVAVVPIDRVIVNCQLKLKKEKKRCCKKIDSYRETKKCGDIYCTSFLLKYLII